MKLTQKDLINASYAVNGGCWHPMTHGQMWVPHEDSWQASSLAVLLGIDVSFSEHYAYKRMPNLNLYQEFWGDGHWGSWREAVVAVAALIGEYKHPHLYWSRHESV